MSLKIALFASGSGSNAENIVRYFANNQHFIFPLIVSNKSDAFVHQRAKNLEIPSVTFAKQQFESGSEIVALLHAYKVDAIVLAGFLLKIPEAILHAFPSKIVNIHPALLPKYGGKGMYGDRVHQAVKAAGENESGITIHYVNEQYDAGNIIFQAKCAVNEGDTVDDIAAKVHDLEYKYFPEVIQTIWG
ncbi:MAG: phosphoribosylglycinamide formyltransferase [Porphyromonadaceae bacterium CG2_30_38_12]|nr:MAG: phosphoribosylglycinamide formyltransferase [Porphyromonadaceae bacterium CG2_30_38_12]